MALELFEPFIIRKLREKGFVHTIKGAKRMVERAKIEAALPKGALIVALDERGKDLSSVQLAGLLTQWKQGGRDVALVIGGADGLDAGFKQGADLLIRISSLTLPHGMVRVLLAEQLYRAWSITQNHPYHRV